MAFRRTFTVTSDMWELLDAPSKAALDEWLTVHGARPEHVTQISAHSNGTTELVLVVTVDDLPPSLTFAADFRGEER
jgi:hypothetical protein